MFPLSKSIGAAFFISCLFAGAEEKKNEVFQITGEVPEGWEVVELTDVPPVEKWVVMKSGERRKLLVRPFGLKPITGSESKFTVKNPLETASGQNLSEVVEAQNENLTQSQDELAVMLARLKELLSTLPNTTEQLEKS